MERNELSAPCSALLLSVFLVILGVGVGSTHDYSPGLPQSEPILLRGGDLYTISGGTLERTDLLFDGGRITAIGRDLEAPPTAQVIDVTGRQIYPGLIAPNTGIGLTEIGAVRATEDGAERGLDNGEIRAGVAYNPDSEIIPTVRSNGIAIVEVAPQGRLVRGRSCVVRLDGWTIEDVAERHDVAMHLGWPRASISTGWWEDQPVEEQEKAQQEERARLRGIFESARAYYIARLADSVLPIDSRWEGFEPLFAGTMPLFIHAEDLRQIEQAVAFGHEFGLQIAIVGGRESWKAARLLRENDIPVILSPVQRLPMREDDDFDLGYKIPVLLHEAGVRFCFSPGGGASSARNLPFQAGQAVAFGLPLDAALRGLTLSAAEILGIHEDLGALEVGRKATLIVSRGDILDPLAAGIEMMFIDGRRVDLQSKHTELYEKYRAR